MRKSVLFLLVCSGISAYGTVWYVDKSNTSGVEDGLAWATAFSTLQAGIAAAEIYGDDEVWVAEGVYDEQRESFIPQRYGGPLNTGSIFMKEGVDLYGGFLGNELARLERAAGVYSTIDGSRSRGDDAAIHVIIGANDALLDGFVVTGGVATHSYYHYAGGGMWNFGTSPTVRNCQFRYNSGGGLSGGVYNNGSFASFEDCAFVGNNGGGMSSSYTSQTEVTDCYFGSNFGRETGGLSAYDGTLLTLRGCLFEGNNKTDWAPGGALRANLSNVVAEGCVFRKNYTWGFGGAVSLESVPWKRSSFVNCLFAFNEASAGGGAVFGNDADFQNCTFAGNVSDTDYGGALVTSASYDTQSFTRVSSSIFWMNGASAIERNAGAVNPVQVEYSNVEGGYTGEGNIDADPEFVDPFGGDFRVTSASPCIDAGASVGAPEADYFGVARPQGAGVDVGFAEFVDADQDGMDDVWEERVGLDPGDPGDAAVDVEGDGIDNLYEFLYHSDPFTGRVYSADYYVSSDGDDDTGDGTEDHPWATIARGVEGAGRWALYVPTNLHVGAGVYVEPVIFVPGVHLVGAGAGATVIQYYQPNDVEHVVVTGAEGASLSDCVITLPGYPPVATTLLRIDDVSMEVSNVILDGKDNLYTLGSLVANTGSSNSVIENCEFRRLHYGIQAVNTGITIRENQFTAIREDAVFVREPDQKDGAAVAVPMLGDAAWSETTGHNVFASIGGSFIINRNDLSVKAENNDWGVYTKEQIAAKMDGAVDFEPYVGQKEEPECGCFAGSMQEIPDWPTGRDTADLMLLGGLLMTFTGMSLVSRRNALRRTEGM